MSLTVSVDQHVARIRDLVGAVPLRIETVSIADALGRITAGPVLSPVDLPLFRNSQMDGFAVRAEDVAHAPTALPISGESAARPGTPRPLVAGTAVRIMTGAPVPDGADAIVPVEDTIPGATPDMVTVGRSRAAGEYVRERGSDVTAGDELLPAGRVLASRHLAALAAAGIGTIEVRARLRVAIITTGSELIGNDQEPLPGQVYDANSVALVAAVRACGAEDSFTARVTDDVDTMLAVLAGAAAASDVIVTSGGISMGDYEVVRESLEPRGAWVGHVAMQPGGPQAIGDFGGVPVLGFPGNPVSTQLSFEVFLAPLLRDVAGLPAARRSSATITSAVRSVAGKRQFLRGLSLEGARVETVAGPGSHLVAGLAASDVLIDVPADIITLEEGDTVEILHL